MPSRKSSSTKYSHKSRAKGKFTARVQKANDIDSIKHDGIASTARKQHQRDHRAVKSTRVLRTRSKSASGKVRRESDYITYFKKHYNTALTVGQNGTKIGKMWRAVKRNGQLSKRHASKSKSHASKSKSHTKGGCDDDWQSEDM